MSTSLVRHLPTEFVSASIRVLGYASCLQQLPLVLGHLHHPETACYLGNGTSTKNNRCRLILLKVLVLILRSFANTKVRNTALAYERALNKPTYYLA
ncbi:hypothetical protein O0I10_006246 [Lichtheimia ornata]|uniref:Uncharacterized protein n=1 Tax=Lichtheimia ornata TaxID=688661 RepID=A0AAD7V4B6_9FUNG|nr:uncharacterized protein O0I10_006246 [Lichtheimia ornata]KAJ8657975.1 hypothetical protein O0I10_006246 [Lichtheimia ornata]